MPKALAKPWGLGWGTGVSWGPEPMEGGPGAWHLSWTL